jgi:hypothetical protein
MTSMRSGRHWISSSNMLLQRAWATIGLPFEAEMIDERSEGILDVEALLMATFLTMGRDRSVTDFPAWIVRFSDVINHQKLKGIWANLPPKHRKRVMERLALFPEMPKTFRDIFALKTSGAKITVSQIERRMNKLDSLAHIAPRSIMIKNRLLYGTGFRADLISLLQVENLKMNARQMSKLLCAADSTISRLLSDLRAGQLLDQNNEMKTREETFPSLFLSSYSVLNLLNMIDAQEFQSKELKRSSIESLELRFDRFTRVLLSAT